MDSKSRATTQDQELTETIRTRKTITNIAWVPSYILTPTKEFQDQEPINIRVLSRSHRLSLVPVRELALTHTIRASQDQDSTALISTR